MAGDTPVMLDLPVAAPGLTELLHARRPQAMEGEAFASDAPRRRLHEPRPGGAEAHRVISFPLRRLHEDPGRQNLPSLHFVFQMLVQGNPQFLAGLLLLDLDPAVIEVGLTHANRTFLQPFLAYTWKDSTTLTLNSESTYDWTAKEWTVPLNLIVSRIYTFGQQPVSLAIGGRVYADTPDEGPDWGVRTVATFLFPAGGR